MSIENLHILKIKLQTPVETIEFKPSMIQHPKKTTSETEDRDEDEEKKKDKIYISDKVKITKSYVDSFIRQAKTVVSLKKKVESQSIASLKERSDKLTKEITELTAQINDAKLKKHRPDKLERRKNAKEREFEQINTQLKEKERDSTQDRRYNPYRDRYGRPEEELGQITDV